MTRLFIVFILSSGLLFSQSKSDSVSFKDLQPQTTKQYKRPTFLRVTGQVLLGTVLGLGGMVAGQVHVSLAPIGWMFASSFGVTAVGGSTGASYWWTFSSGAIAMAPFAIAMIGEDHPLGVAALAFFGMITSITVEIIVYWLTKDYGESETHVDITQRELDIYNFQNPNKILNPTQPDISVPVFHINF